MPNIAGFIQSLLTEDMYATGLIEKMEQRIADLNNGQLRLLVRYCETKVPGLTNKTVIDAYAKLLRTAIRETDKRYEEEVRGERERLAQLRAAHAGVNAKAWDTSHASLDRELAKFQKFLKSKARRAAEEEVLQKSMEKLHFQLMAIPARRVAAENRRRSLLSLGGIVALVISPITLLSMLPVSTWGAIGATMFTLIIAGIFVFIGIIGGVVITPRLDDDAIEAETRICATRKLKGYRAEVRRNYEEFEQAFDADMEWRDKWVAAQKHERKKERRKRNKQQHREGRGDGARIAPGGEEQKGDAPDPDSSDHTLPATTRDEERSRTLLVDVTLTASGKETGTVDSNDTTVKVGVQNNDQPWGAEPRKSAGGDTTATSTEVDVLFNTTTQQSSGTIPPDVSPTNFPFVPPAENNVEILDGSEVIRDGSGDARTPTVNSHSQEVRPALRRASPPTSRSIDEKPRQLPHEIPGAAVVPIGRSPPFGGNLEVDEGMLAGHLTPTTVER